MIDIIKCNSWHEIFGKTPEPATGWGTRRYKGAGLQISKKDSAHKNNLNTWLWFNMWNSKPEHKAFTNQRNKSHWKFSAMVLGS